jgi:hypothetical protein
MRLHREQRWLALRSIDQAFNVKLESDWEESGKTREQRHDGKMEIAAGFEHTEEKGIEKVD